MSIFFKGGGGGTGLTSKEGTSLYTHMHILVPFFSKSNEYQYDVHP